MPQDDKELNDLVSFVDEALSKPLDDPSADLGVPIAMPRKYPEPEPLFVLGYQVELIEESKPKRPIPPQPCVNCGLYFTTIEDKAAHTLVCETPGQRRAREWCERHFGGAQRARP